MAYPLTTPLLDLLLLSIIHQQDSYGYQISQQLRGLSSMKDSALYPILRRLSENELVETYDRQYQGRNRKYYRITEAGNTRRLVLEEEWRNHVQSIDTIIAKNNCRKDVEVI